MSNNYMTLLGAEDVTRAAGRMSSAAEQMMRAAGSMEQTTLHIEQSNDRFLREFEVLVERMEAVTPQKTRYDESHSRPPVLTIVLLVLVTLSLMWSL